VPTINLKRSFSLAMLALLLLRADSGNAQSGPSNGGVTGTAAQYNVETLTGLANENVHHDQIVEVIDSDDRIADAEHQQRIAQLEAAPTPMRPQHIADENEYYAKLKNQIALKRQTEDLRHQLALQQITAETQSPRASDADADAGGGQPQSGGSSPPESGASSSRASDTAAAEEAAHFQQILQEIQSAERDEDLRHQQRLAQLEDASTPLKPQHIADENEHHADRKSELRQQLQIEQAKYQEAIQRITAARSP